MVVSPRRAADGACSRLRQRGNWCLLYIGIAPKTIEQRYDAALPNSSLPLLRQGHKFNSILRATLGLLLEERLGTVPKRISSNNWGFEPDAEARA